MRGVAAMSHFISYTTIAGAGSGASGDAAAVAGIFCIARAVAAAGGPATATIPVFRASSLAVDRSQLGQPPRPLGIEPHP
jgi:hypothetical protein